MRFMNVIYEQAVGGDFIGRVITYVRRATRNYPGVSGNVANGDILRAHFSRLLQKSEIYCPGFVASVE